MNLRRGHPQANHHGMKMYFKTRRTTCMRIPRQKSHSISHARMDICSHPSTSRRTHLISHLSQHRPHPADNSKAQDRVTTVAYMYNETQWRLDSLKAFTQSWDQGVRKKSKSKSQPQKQRHPRISHIAAPTLDKTAPISLPCADLPPTCRKAPQAVSQRMRVGRLRRMRGIGFSGCPSMQRRIHTRRRLICLLPKATGSKQQQNYCLMHIFGPLRTSLRQ